MTNPIETRPRTPLDQRACRSIEQAQMDRRVAMLEEMHAQLRNRK
jgi:hypothetical protein